MEAYLGGLYLHQFNRFVRQWRVYMANYVRMVIGETRSGSQIERFIQEVALLHDEMQSGVVASQLLTEEGGNMVVLITSFTSRDECLAFHDSRPYRAFVQKTQHLLVGSFVVKMFTERMGT